MKVDFGIIARGETFQELLHIWERIQDGRLPLNLKPIIKEAILELCKDVSESIK